MAEQLRSPQVGLVVDVYHVWWDHQVYREIARAGERIFAFHVSDWIVPLPDTLMGRGLMGDGVIEIPRLREAVEAAGYRGPIEVEIFNQQLWSRSAEEIVEVVAKRFQECV
jgi:sugar phosphate isomerase/epimerase